MLVDDAELNLVDYLLPYTVKFVCSIILWIIQTLGIGFLYSPPPQPSGRSSDNYQTTSYD